MHIKKSTFTLRNGLFLLVASFSALGHTQEKAETTNTVTLNQELQQILQQVQAIDQENARLEQAIQQATEENQKLGEEIDKLLPEQDTPPAEKP
jgi:septal ring factor EnvC (AmiA/AmiB activator)